MTATTERSDVRVRFCPSPTGNPHVGLVRTALYNWAWCRHVGGTFVFRIEDTDAARDSQASYEQLLGAMQWLGFNWDEGPEIGGPYGPYRQSERRDVYDEVVRRLVDAGYVYESFTTSDETEARNKAAGLDPKRGYDNHDRHLTDADRAAFRAEGREPVLRFRMPGHDLQWDDLVRGEVLFAADQVSDFVVVRANGDPLYTLTNPVDDAMMRITHVLRGEDLLPSTPRQIALHSALVELGISDRVPQFGHLPYVMGEGNKKLSKRDPQASLDLYREQGYLPEGLLNYLALLGWSIAPDHDVFTVAEMVEAFDIGDVNANPARFDPAKCLALNGEHIRRLSAEQFAERFVVHAVEYGGVDAAGAHAVREAAPLVQERCKTLAEALDLVRFLVVDPAEFVMDEAAAAKVLTHDNRAVLAAGRDALEPLTSWDHADIETALRAMIESRELKLGKALAPFRVAITGSTVSPPLFESMALLGRETTLDRLRQAIG